jgi:hypothetical protein
MLDPHPHPLQRGEKGGQGQWWGFIVVMRTQREWGSSEWGSLGVTAISCRGLRCVQGFSVSCLPSRPPPPALCQALGNKPRETNKASLGA